MSLMNVCVAPCRCVCVRVCVFSRLLYAVVWHSPWQLWTFHSARTVREREGEREREGGEVRRGRGKPRQKVGMEWGVCLWGETAYVLVCFGAVRFLPVLPSTPGDVWWRSGLSVGWNPTRGSAQTTSLILSWYVDWSTTQTFTWAPAPRVSRLQHVLHEYNNHPDIQLFPKISICFQSICKWRAVALFFIERLPPEGVNQHWNMCCCCTSARALTNTAVDVDVIQFGWKLIYHWRMFCYHQQIQWKDQSISQHPYPVCVWVCGTSRPFVPTEDVNLYEYIV